MAAPPFPPDPRHDLRTVLRRHPRRTGLDHARASRQGACWLIEIFFIPPWPGVDKRAIPDGLTVEHLIFWRDGERVEIELLEWNVVHEELAVTVTVCGHELGADRERWRIEIAGPRDLDPEFSAVEIVIVAARARRPHRRAATREPAPPPLIDYFARDFESFRRAILDRIRREAPEWRDTSEADLGVMLAELLAYTGDRLSYWQDAVATEAYLDTARLRESARRHARLLDYRPGEGSAPHVWIHVTVNADAVVLPAGTPFLTNLERQPVRIPVELYRDRGLSRVFDPVQVFETLHDTTLFAAHDVLPIHVGSGDDGAVLEAGATAAALAGHFPGLHLGDVLLLEEVAGADTMEAARRHLVRLDAAPVLHRHAAGHALTHIRWHAEDALPYAFPLRRRQRDGRWMEHLSVFRGNLVLADFGRTIAQELLPVVTAGERYRPELVNGPLLYASRVEDRGRASAHALSAPDPARAVPQIQLWQLDWDTASAADRRPWRVRRDLLQSHAWSRDFVVDSANPITLRFGDGEYGRLPAPGTRLSATYRVGNLRRGAIGPGAIGHIVTDDERCIGVRNPLPASGLALPETVAEIRLNAPEAHLVQRRCVTAEDYVETSRALPDVHDAAVHAEQRDGHTRVTVHVDRADGRPADRSFRARVRAALEPRRLLGSSVHVRPPQHVPIRLELSVWLAPEYVRSTAALRVRRALVGDDDTDPPTPLFAPGAFAFGQPVWAGRVIDAVMSVQGVVSVTIDRLERWSDHHAPAPVPEKLTPGPYEIVQLVDDRERPETGQLVLHLHGGRA